MVIFTHTRSLVTAENVIKQLYTLCKCRFRVIPPPVPITCEIPRDHFKEHRRISSSSSSVYYNYIIIIITDDDIFCSPSDNLKSSGIFPAIFHQPSRKSMTCPGATKRGRKYIDSAPERNEKIMQCWVYDISTLWPPHENDDDDLPSRASRCLLLFFSVFPRVGGPICIRRTTYRNRRRRRFEGCCRRTVSGVGNVTGVAKCRTGLLGEVRRPIDPAHTANNEYVQRTKQQAEPVVSRPSGKPSVRYRFLTFFLLVYFSRRPTKSSKP